MAPFSHKKIGLYIHVPFCRYLCLYCDFEKTKALPHLVRKYGQALLAELDQLLPLLAEVKLSSLYFGGGTPSLLPLELFEKVMGFLHPRLVEGAEITVETTPDGLDREKARSLRKLGVNRISIGIETFDDQLLARMNRQHKASQNKEIVRWLRQTGYENLSGDLLFALPGQSVQGFQRDLLEMIDLELDHVSVYGLKVEPHTPLYRDITKGRISETSEEIYAECYLLACQSLKEAGYEHYEVSNFCRPARACVYNLSIWQLGEYLGLGPSAWSCTARHRVLRCAKLSDYIRGSLFGRPVDHKFERNLAEETWMLGLRLNGGVNLMDYRKRFGEDAYFKQWQKHFPSWAQIGLMKKKGDYTFCTEKGFLVQNEILSTILAAA